MLLEILLSRRPSHALERSNRGATLSVLRSVVTARLFLGCPSRSQKSRSDTPEKRYLQRVVPRIRHSVARRLPTRLDYQILGAKCHVHTQKKRCALEQGALVAVSRQASVDTRGRFVPRARLIGCSVTGVRPDGCDRGPRRLCRPPGQFVTGGQQCLCGCLLAHRLADGASRRRTPSERG